MVDVVGRAKIIVESVVDAKSIDESSSRIGAGLRKGAIIGVAALGTVAVSAHHALEAFEEAESASRKLNQVLDNMGKSDAGPATEKLADDLRKLTGVDDEVIKGGETILATFSQVAKSAGEVGGTFERATKLSLDLAASGFGDVRSASVQLGKALQDPVKGITALNRSGITFTADQKKVIKSLVETGEVGKAQALILKEVEKQVGGTAAAGATESGKISSSLKEIEETLGFFVNDLITTGDHTDTLSDKLDHLNDELTDLEDSDAWAAIKGALLGVGKAIKFVGGAIGDLLTVSVHAGEQFHDFQDDLDDGWQASKIAIKEDVHQIVTAITGAPQKITDKANEWRKAGHDLIQHFWDGVTSKVTGKIGDIVGGLKDALNDSLGLPRTINIPFSPDVHIPAFAGGVRNFAGGLAKVGENGPELVGLPAGSDVYSNSESRAIMAGSSDGGGFSLTQVFNGPNSLAQARAEADWAAKYGTRFGSATSAAAL